MFLRYNKFYDISTTEHIIKPGRSPCPSTQVRNTVGGVNILVLTLANVGDKFTFYKRITSQKLHLFVSQPSNIRLLLTLPYWEFLTRQFKLWADSGIVGINYHKVRITVKMELVWKSIDLELALFKFLWIVSINIQLNLRLSLRWVLLGV